MMKPVVLDASALIASIYEEKGADAVDRRLANALISTVNLTEVASYMIRQGMAPDEAEMLLRDLSLVVEDYDENQAFAAAGLLNKTASKGLSLGDRACLALALTKGLPVLTADRAWASLDTGVKVETIR